MSRHVRGSQIHTYTTPFLKSLHWLKVNECIEYITSLSPIYKVLTATLPIYLHNRKAKKFDNMLSLR